MVGIFSSVVPIVFLSVFPTRGIFISLFMLDLVTLSVAQIVWHLMIALLVNNDLERVCKEGVMV
jgi:hypothetical protein